MTLESLQTRAEQILVSAGILPVITVDSVEQGQRIADALLEGGLTALELTLRTPAALATLEALKKALPDIVIGAGTVLDEAQIRQSVDAGADFLVTPGTPPALAEALARAPIPAVPGGATPTEFMSLLARGFRCCKLFPASAVGGLAMLKGLAGPLGQLKLCPTGGISESNAAEFLAQPNVLCIGGSWMVPKDWLAAGDWARVRESAARAAAIVAAARG
ncbi:bifunctional 4-hydroxy-2-oxoglutarate aldolase/2-dehydro-3-deoxy-phosphogluconate aldolase [Luteimonas wenzhouensis]|uniref:2-dehydro-3-deoxy-phosphogluconate aldolase n=1 Tax=Luteimonas wenzhouensis TaxID=2599615 RepID=A0A5C5U8P0_9GAMM|nr:bifunctional 4-hydroxy-2-oxoglutarate aldolase/2-dehydro-3-deoxy-phosphogluconate aldolase [Luteimonas wenzhouensis]NLW95620.1 bifunctional 4-hydroxy-2-oxoglutarate aldolase/2-dehydro-3-deoxy-phosphogluconate aldolase [Xanthomonadaceae bacterium]TWT21760.1 bifunctional 4-hydroxy-2-oxoglutarate aldolase/2-dehydro-3-deoxy-phosphogluconate aldolase [Luteimonas wenzhouensis]